MENSRTVKKDPQWIAAADRLPTQEDADCCDNVWCSLRGHVELMHWDHWSDRFGDLQRVYWMRTGFVKPEPVTCKEANANTTKPKSALASPACSHAQYEGIGAITEGLANMLIYWCPDCGALKRTMTNWKYTDYPWREPKRAAMEINTSSCPSPEHVDRITTSAVILNVLKEPQK